MLQEDLKRKVLKLVKVNGCMTITTLLKELNLIEDMNKHPEVYECIRQLLYQGKIDSHSDYVKDVTVRYH